MCSTKLLAALAAPAVGAVRAALADFSRAVDALQSESLDGLADHEVLAVFQDLETHRHRLPTVDHRLITGLECRSTARKLLARGAAGLLTQLLHVDVGEAKSRVRAAAALGPRTAITGEPLDPVYPATAAAQAAGTISEKHARIITQTIGHLPHHLDEDTAALAEQTLVKQAETLRPSELGKVADRLTAYLDPDGQLSEDTDRAARRGLSIGKQRPDGMSPINGLLDPATHALVDAAFSALPRPDGDTPDPRSPAQRNHDALAALCRNALATGGLPSNRGLPATLVLTMGIDQLEDAAGVATTPPPAAPSRSATPSRWPPTRTPCCACSTPTANPSTSAAAPASPPPPNAWPSTPATVAAPDPAATCPHNGPKSTTSTNTNTADAPTSTRCVWSARSITR